MTGAAITLDVDWAPDFAIDHAAGLLAQAGVRATWFVTHASPAVERLMARPDLFEIGIHPNFLPGTTHGRSESEILAHCMQLAPQARIVRTHGLVQSSNLLEKIVDETPVAVDVSLFLPHARSLAPVDYHWGAGKTLVRLPYMWEDDFEMVRPAPEWDVGSVIASGDGLMIFDFHPIHVYLNSRTLDAYRSMRALGPVGTASQVTADGFVGAGKGARYAFESAISALAGVRTRSLADVAASNRR